MTLAASATHSTMPIVGDKTRPYLQRIIIANRFDHVGLDRKAFATSPEAQALAVALRKSAPKIRKTPVKRTQPAIPKPH